VFRGGSFDSNASNLRAARRDSSDPAYRYYGIGARCARTQ
jgi:formylglycine-generating enzyme required for sulfatase activity